MTFVPAPSYLPTYIPTLPFKKTIPDGLHVGMVIYMEGVTKENVKRFMVNFALGPKPEADIAFHFNPHFDSWDKVVFNSQQSGQWGKEQTKNSMPFKVGEHFQLLVMVLQEHYMVKVNGNPFYEFRHRMPFQKVTHLYVHGDMTIQSIHFIDCSPAPSQAAVRSNLLTCNPPASPVSSLSLEAPPVFNLPVPYVVNLQGGLTLNRTFIIKGFIQHSAYRFAINFNMGDTGDIALHINPRIGDDVVVRNNFQNGAWKTEERNISNNPFGPGKSFDLSICADHYRFQVFNKGKHIFDFQHRVKNFTKIDLLEITGDVLLSYVQV